MLTPGTVRPRKDWTVLYYGGGNNNLQSSIKKAWSELANQELPENVDTFVQHFDEQGKMQEAHFQGNGVKTVGEPTEEVVNSGDPEVFQEFLLKGMKEFPASRYLVVVSSHGSGAEGVIQDETSGDNLSPQEVRKALIAASSENQGKPIDMILFDACQMASTEMAVQLSGAAGVMIASMDNVGSSGFHLPTILEEASEHKEPGALAKSLVHNSDPQQKNAFRTLSAVDLSQTEKLSNAFDSWASEIQNLDSQARQSLAGIAKSCRRSINAPETQMTFDSIADDLLSQYPVDEGLFKLWKDGTKPGKGASLTDFARRVLNDKELSGANPSFRAATEQLLVSHQKALLEERPDASGHSGLTIHFPMENPEGPLYAQNVEPSAWETAYNTIIPEGEELQFEPTELEKELAPFLPKTTS